MGQQGHGRLHAQREHGSGRLYLRRSPGARFVASGLGHTAARNFSSRVVVRSVAFLLCFFVASTMLLPGARERKRARISVSPHALVGNGDVHRLHQLGTCYSLVDAERDPTSICDAVRAGRVQVVAEPLPFLTAATTVADMLASDVVARLYGAKVRDAGVRGAEGAGVQARH